jgi:hypothetical protein
MLTLWSASLVLCIVSEHNTLLKGKCALGPFLVYFGD